MNKKYNLLFLEMMYQNKSWSRTGRILQSFQKFRPPMFWKIRIVNQTSKETLQILTLVFTNCMICISYLMTIILNMF